MTAPGSLTAHELSYQIELVKERAVHVAGQLVLRAEDLAGVRTEVLEALFELGWKRGLDSTLVRRAPW